MGATFNLFWTLIVVASNGLVYTGPCLLVADRPQTVSKDNSLGSPQPPTFMLTQKISGIAAGATPSRTKK